MRRARKMAIACVVIVVVLAFFFFAPVVFWFSSMHTSSSGSGTGIPEFPVQIGFTLLVTVVIVMSYLFAKRGLQIGKQAPV